MSPARAGGLWSTFGVGLLAAVTVALVFVCGPGEAAAADGDEIIVVKINEYVRRGWDDNEIKPSERTADGEFARRVSLDIAGHIPSFEELMDFLEEDAPDKRLELVNQLLEESNYVRYWTNIWANLLVGRGNRRTDRGDLERYLRTSIARNEPYEKFVYELISAEGNSNENGAVAFLAAHLNDGQVPATSITSRVFLGLQVQCTQCHNHPFNDWKQDQFWSMNGFFRGTTRQGAGNANRGEFALYDGPDTRIVFFEKRNGLMQATPRKFVDGTAVSMTEYDKPREQLAKLVTDPTKPFMARTQVNRMWGHFFGYGFTKPLDDMGPHNPPSRPELLDYLADEFRKSGYDNKRLIRWICASDAYQLSSRAHDGNVEDDPAVGNTPHFSRMYVKPFSSEQLYDSLLIATQADKAGGRSYEQAEQQRQQWLAQFVRTFGTDENDENTTFNGTIPQALVMMNGSLTKTAINGAEGSFLRRVLESPTGDPRSPKATNAKKPARTATKTVASKSPGKPARGKSAAKGIPAKIETLFLVTLARTPTDKELNAFNNVFQKSGASDPILGLQDVFWALLNSNEFIMNH